MLATDSSWKPRAPNSSSAASKIFRSVRRPRSVFGVFSPGMLIPFFMKHESYVVFLRIIPTVNADPGQFGTAESIGIADTASRNRPSIGDGGFFATYFGTCLKLRRSGL